MRFEKLRAQGLGPFREPIELDLAALPGRIVAVTGSNGAGKSTALELLAGAVYRTCPTRGSLRDLATERGAWAEVEVVNGARWTIRQSVDSVSGKGEALILDAEGRPVLDDGKVRSADAWVRDHLPPAEVLFSSIFSAQGSEGFLAMKPADRKAVLNRILGIEHLEEKATRARERARAAKTELQVVEARIADARDGAAGVDETRTELGVVAGQVEAAEAALREATEAVEHARAAADHRQRLEAAQGRWERLREREAVLRAVLADAEEIRAAAADVERLTARRDEHQREADEHQREADRLRAEVDALRREHAQTKQAGTAARERADRARKRLADREAIDAAERALPAAREDLARSEREREETRAALDALREERAGGLGERVEALRGALAEIDAAPSLHDAQVFAQQSLDHDDATAEAARTLPARIDAARAASTAAERRYRHDVERVQELERTSARAGDLAHAQADLDAAEGEVAKAAARMREIAEGATPLVKRSKDAQRRVSAALDHARQAFDALALVEPAARRVAELDQAEARLAELDPELVAARQDVMMAIEAFDAFRDAPATEDALRREADARTELAAAGRHHTRAEEALTRAEKAAERVAVLEEDRRRIEAELADWNVLARDLGRDGLQAALIDAAGPELTELVNDLLASCHGSRFTVVIETTRLSADGKRQLEGLDVRVIDTERGRDALVETYSGGERVILGEAVSLALTMLACRNAGIESPTLIRDESGAALDPTNAQAYLAMLRRAADLLDARVLLVSHSQEVQDGCDARVVVADGRVQVEA